MNPWLIFWAPQVHLPFGGSVAQRIEPNTNWFFDAIAPTAGDAKIERQAFEVASYGRQLGLLTEVLVDLTTATPPTTAQGKRALKRLKGIQTQIEDLKGRNADELLLETDRLIARLKKVHPEKLPEVRRQLERALSVAED